jgi:hypothetical protein
MIFKKAPGKILVIIAPMCAQIIFVEKILCIVKLGLTIQGALGEINFLFAFGTIMGAIKFIGKDFFFFPTFGAFTDERL